MASREASNLAVVAERFADPNEFGSSPLYRSLARTVAVNSDLLHLASRGRPGQVPTFLLFGAIHTLLLAGKQHDLASFFPSIAGLDTRPTDEAGPALIDFCAIYESELTAIVETRLVQTNVVRRALALCIGLAAIGSTVRESVHLVEVGASAGLLLRFDRYGYRLGGQSCGDPRSPVQIAAEWRGDRPVPDLDLLPSFASTTGIDLNPLDAANPDDRRWLEALVWPENRGEAELLHHALELVAQDPPPILAGDAIELCPDLARRLPPGEPRVAFHAVTRLHVPSDHLAAFDAAINTLGQNGPLYHLLLEGPGDLDLRSPDGTLTHLARVGGRVEWVQPLNL
jgi:hypothetical protein